MGEGISLRELARRLGRSAPTLGELAKKGKIPRNADGTYNEEAVRAAYVRNSDPAQRKALKRKVGEAVPEAVPPPIVTLDEAREAVSLIRRVLSEEGRELDGPLSYDDIRSAETILKARKHAQEIAVAETELIRKVPVMRHVEEAFANYRKELQALPARFGAQIAAEVGCDVAAIDAALSNVIRAHLESLSAPVVKAN
ncbi:MAG: hypothetical protein WAP47_00740 [Candidatus Rokuibacteriota bacterium]